MQISKRKGEQSKVLPISFIENRLEKMILIQGEDKLNEFRDKLREVSILLNMPVEFEKLNRIISALMPIHNVNILTNDSSRARATGVPFDAARVELFSILFDTLKDHFFVERTNMNTDEDSYRMFLRMSAKQKVISILFDHLLKNRRNNMTDKQEQIIINYKADLGSVYNTWFVNNNDRLKAFRSNRRGVKQAILMEEQKGQRTRLRLKQKKNYRFS